MADIADAEDREERYVFEIKGHRCVLTARGWECPTDPKLERYLNEKYAPHDRPISVISQVAMTGYDVLYSPLQAKLIAPRKLPSDLIE